MCVCVFVIEYAISRLCVFFTYVFILSVSVAETVTKCLTVFLYMHVITVTQCAIDQLIRSVCVCVSVSVCLCNLSQYLGLIKCH